MGESLEYESIVVARESRRLTLLETTNEGRLRLRRSQNLVTLTTEFLWRLDAKLDRQHDRHVL